MVNGGKLSTFRACRYRALSGHDTAAQVNQSGSDQTPHAFGVVHDSGNQLPGLHRIEITDRKEPDMSLNFLPHFNDHTLARNAEDL